jgi:hypothetical protein
VTCVYCGALPSEWATPCSRTETGIHRSEAEAVYGVLPASEVRTLLSMPQSSSGGGGTTLTYEGLLSIPAGVQTQRRRERLRVVQGGRDSSRTLPHLARGVLRAVE